MKYRKLLPFLLFLLSTHVFSQTLFLRSGAFQPGQNISQRSIDSLAKTAPRFAGKTFAVLQFDHLPSEAEKAALAADGIELLDYLPDNAFTVALRQFPAANSLQRAKAKAIFQLSPQQKMQEEFARGQIPSWAVQVPGTVDVWISFYKTLDATQVLQQLKAQNVEVLSTEHLPYRIIALRMAANRVSELASLPFVEYIQPAPPKDQPLNYNSRTGSRATLLNASVANGGRGLNGEGVTVGHGDNADLQLHADFSGRLINRNAAPFNAHGVHTAGTIAGAGNINELYRGYAPKATILSQSFNYILVNAARYVKDYRMVITNNSYGDIIDCEYHGTYDLTARLLDQQALDLPNLLQVFSAGNSGQNTCLPYPKMYRTVLGGYQSAKNVITVGASTDSGMVSDFSSRGPVKDGRLKPEIIAMGQSVISTWSANTYAYNNGTSMSAPAVSGGLALLYQRYRQLHGGADPQNGLMKAILCNGATDRGASGPDFFYGFGWMNLLRSVEMIEGNHYLSGSSSNNTTTTHTIQVPAHTAQLKLLLYWNDVPASIISTKNLVNDLDLEVVSPAGTVVQPKVLDTAMASLGNAATEGADHVNNLEQIVIDKPAAGTYTIRVRGTTVTTAQQDYFLAYDPIPTGIVLSSPAGGMTLVPGESSKISWDSYGLSGDATIAFSADGGATWSPVNTTVDVARAVYTWQVPAVLTSNALVRVSHPGSGETAVSKPFTILGQPVASLAPVQCETYFGLNWTPVPGASDYEVLLLKGSEMQPVATTTGTAYTFNGLSKDSLYFATVRARINGIPGRRAVAVSRQPNSGSCAGTISDNDVKMEALLTPHSGRKATSTALGTAEVIRVRIKNLDDAPVSNFTLSYAVNGGAPVSETVTAPVAAGTTYDHRFSTTADLSATGTYSIRITVNNSGDTNTANDTLTYVVKQLENNPLDLSHPFFDGVETALPATYEKDTIGVDGNDRYDFGHTTPYGRLRTQVDSGLAYAGRKAFTLDASRYVPAGNANYLYGTFHLGNYTAAANDLRLDFQLRQHGQMSNPANRVWIRGSDTQPWIEAANLDSEETDEGIFKRIKSIEVSNLLLANGQDFSSSFQVRWGQWGLWPVTDEETAAGYTIDDIRLFQAFNDVQVARIDSPAVNNCSLASSSRVTITVRNASRTTLTNVPVRFRVNGVLAASESIASLPANTTQSYTFTTPAGISNFGAFVIEAYVDLPADTFHDNDTARLTVFNEPLINSFPYLENFEKGNGHFYTDGLRSSWEYGTPNSRKISGAASGARAWKTSLQGSYNNNEFSYLYSPCFDISGMSHPTLSFSVALDLEDCGSTTCDATWVEYSADGLGWTKLGTAGAGTNWYNKPAPRNSWSIQNNTWWHVATQALPAGLSRLRLRFVLASDAGVAREGMAIDDIHLYDNANGIYDGPTLALPVSQSVSGNNWVDFTANGQLIASIQPGNQSLGATAAQVYLNNGPVRSASNQYYHNRNLTIKPANAPADSVSVRFYFLDTETDSLLRASGCPACAKPASAYSLGVSQYSDPDKTVENGSLADNQQGFWNFIASANVAKVPFDKGYYAEFKVADFSEFWLNGGGPDLQSPLPVKLMNLTAVQQGNLVLVSWKLGSETDVLRYEIEVARGADALQKNAFSRLGEVASLGNTPATRTYRFTDAEADKFGVRYYRLKMINQDGTFRYSPVRAVVFPDAVLWQVYPNPGSGAFALVYRQAAGEMVTARLYDTKGSLVKEYRSAATGFLQKLTIDISANNYASGVYLLRLQTGSAEKVFRLYKQ